MKISIIIPVYNAEKYLERAVKSALNQSETGEVILVEDDSPDNALELCMNLEEEYERVKLFRHPDGKNHGAGASRNLGIEKSDFDFIAFFDVDLRLTQDTEITIRLVSKCRLYPGELKKPVANRFWHEQNRTAKNDENERHYKKLCAKKILFWSQKHHNRKEKAIVFNFCGSLFSYGQRSSPRKTIFRQRFDDLVLYLKMMLFWRVYLDRILIVRIIGVFSRKIGRIFDSR